MWRFPPPVKGGGIFATAGYRARSRLSLPPDSQAEELSFAAANNGSIVWTLTSRPWITAGREDSSLSSNTP